MIRAGLIFKGVSSRSLGLAMRSVSRLVLASATRSAVNLPGIPGSVDFEADTYQEGEISVIFGWLTSRASESAELGEALSGWLHNDGKYYDLIFNDRPNRKYRAKVTAALPMNITPCSGSLTVTFTVNPPHPFALDGSPVSPEDAQARLLWDTAVQTGTEYIQTFYASGTMRFTVAGTSAVKPVITLVGHLPAGLLLEYAGDAWQYTVAQSWDGIRIDCSGETVTRLSDGATLIDNVNPSAAAFFSLVPGQAELAVTGEIAPFPESLTVAVDFLPEFGG